MISRMYYDLLYVVSGTINKLNVLHGERINTCSKSLFLEFKHIIISSSSSKCYYIELKI